MVVMVVETSSGKTGKKKGIEKLDNNSNKTTTREPINVGARRSQPSCSPGAANQSAQSRSPSLWLTRASIMQIAHAADTWGERAEREREERGREHKVERKRENRDWNREEDEEE